MRPCYATSSCSVQALYCGWRVTPLFASLDGVTEEYVAGLTLLPGVDNAAEGYMGGATRFEYDATVAGYVLSHYGAVCSGQVV